MISSSASFLWMCNAGDSLAFLHPVSSMGSVWSLTGKDRWSTISAEALYASHGALACLSPTGGLWLIDPTSLVASDVPLPDTHPAVCVAQRPETLWLLSASGDLWIRGDVSSSYVTGTHWQRFDLTQISDVHLRHVSLGMEVAWAVDTQGAVYMRQGSLSPPHPNACPRPGCRAVTEEGKVYERHGVALPSNYIGSSWHNLLGTLASVSVSVDGELWGLTQCGELCRHHSLHSLKWRLSALSLCAPCDSSAYHNSNNESRPGGGHITQH
ncbi:hypothetical protein FHG87_007795 [Trinorchestia longiramus]|nr:hypothetical protein FHG87_007795 [Trinorchestia longiramus]